MQTQSVSSPTSVMSAPNGMLFAYIAGTECPVIQWMNEPGITSPAPGITSPAPGITSPAPGITSPAPPRGRLPDDEFELA